MLVGSLHTQDNCLTPRASPCILRIYGDVTGRGRRIKFLRPYGLWNFIRRPRPVMSPYILRILGESLSVRQLSNRKNFRGERSQARP